MPARWLTILPTTSTHRDSVRGRRTPRPFISVCLVLLVSCGEDRRLAHQSAALGTLLDLRRSLSQFKDRCGEYPLKLTRLGTGAVNACAGRSLSWAGGALGSGDGFRYVGYVWRYKGVVPGRSSDDTRVVHFTVTLTPVSCEVCKTFWLDDSGIIRQAIGRPASQEDQPAEPQASMKTALRRYAASGCSGGAG